MSNKKIIKSRYGDRRVTIDTDTLWLAVTRTATGSSEFAYLTRQGAADLRDALNEYLGDKAEPAHEPAVTVADRIAAYDAVTQRLAISTLGTHPNNEVEYLLTGQRP